MEYFLLRYFYLNLDKEIYIFIKMIIQFKMKLGSYCENIVGDIKGYRCNF